MAAAAPQLQPEQFNPFTGLAPSPPIGQTARDLSAHLLHPTKFVEHVGTPAIDKRGARLPHHELYVMCNSYLDEAREARQGGLGRGREDVWGLNWDAYWANYDYSEKEDWQHQAQMPEVANFVERFAASLREFLVSQGDYHESIDLLDPKNQLGHLIDRVMKALLARCGISPTGHRIGFPRVFTDILKGGALMNVCLSVLPGAGGPVLSWVDAREIFLDPTGNATYRIREMEIEKHKLFKKMAERHADGSPVYNNAAIQRVLTGKEEEQRWRKYRSQGHGNAEGTNYRKTVPIHEYLCSVIDNNGELIAENQLIVMANRRQIIRGPEPNPFWHKRDWILYDSIINVPGSVYGRTYVELFRDLADVFINLTNQMMDSVNTSSMNSYMVWPEALDDPSQLDEGMSPNKMFLAAEGWPVGQKFIDPIELGRLYPESFTAWRAMKSELLEAAGQNELQLGGLARKSDVTATEINTASGGANSLVKAMGNDLEEGTLGPAFDLLWWTFLQGFDPNVDVDLARELGPSVTQMLVSQREEFRSRNFRFKSRAISGAIERRERLQGLLGLLQVIGSAPALAAIFTRDFSMSQLMRFLMHDFGIDPDRLAKSEQEVIQDQLARVQAAGQVPGGGGGAGSPAAPPQLGAIAAGTPSPVGL